MQNTGAFRLGIKASMCQLHLRATACEQVPNKPALALIPSQVYSIRIFDLCNPNHVLF